MNHEIIGIKMIRIDKKERVRVFMRNILIEFYIAIMNNIIYENKSYKEDIVKRKKINGKI